MNNEEIKNKIKELKQQINEYNNYYYDKNISKISDTEFDSLMQDLIELENKYPHLLTDDSPSQKIYGLINEKFQKYSHDIPMLSLANAFTFEDLESFDRRVKKSLNKKALKYSCEYKIDGLSISLLYKNGKLFKGLTRGDGEIGEDITKNILQINSIPKEIEYKRDLIVRGEAFFTNEQFNVLNIEKRNKKEKEFANARNAASGTLRQLDSRIVKTRNLSFIAYFINKKEQSESLKDDFKFLQENNFPIDKKHNKILNTMNDVIEYIKILTNKREKIGYEVDGIVIKVSDHSYQKILSETSKIPKWSVAYKFESARKLTILENIFPTVGRTGKITLNASLQPVEIAGTIVKSATLHNPDYIISNDIRIGDYVWVKKAGDIIPKVIKPEINKRTSDVIQWEGVKNCPECNEKLVKKNQSIDLFCINNECHKQYLRSIEHFVSKKGMNIQGISNKILEKLFDLEIVKTFIDLYKLEEHKKEIMKIENFGSKMFLNLINSINKSKNISLERFIFALGIPNIGSYNATLLANHFKDIKKLLHIHKHDIEFINDIGPIIAKSVKEYFGNKNNKKLILDLLSCGINVYYEEIDKKFNNKSFVFTGKLEKPRIEYTNRIKKLGGHISSIVSAKTTYLIIGDKPGMKYLKAKELEINIITEEQLEEILKG